MAFEGYFIRLYHPNGTLYYDVSPSMMKIGTYQVTWEGQDLSAYRTSAGKLKRNALESRPPKVEFQVRNAMTNAELTDFMTHIKAMIHSKAERKYKAKVYIPEIDGYITDEVYMVDPTFSIYRLDGNTIYYNSFRMAFIGYGTESSWSSL